MVDEFYLVYLTLGIFLSQLHRNLDTLMHIGLIGQGRELTLHVQTQLLSFLIDLATNGEYLDILTADGLVVFIHSMHHHLDGVGVETSAE